MVRCGSLFGQRNETGFADLPILEVSLRTGVRVRDMRSGKRKQVMSDVGKYKRATRGDLAYNMMRMWQGALGVVPVNGLVSPAYVVARPYADVDPNFFGALFRTTAYMAEIDACSRGIVKNRNRLYWDQFKQMLAPCPPREEQAAIVRFLAWANGRIGKAIRAKQKVIALLNEQKQAVVHRAVTRGLDASVPLKESGVKWLGEIPRHWEILRSKYIFREVDDRSVSGREIHLSMSQKLGLVPHAQIEAKRLISESYTGARICAQGDLVLNRLKAHLGVFALAPQRGLVSPDYSVFRPVREIDGRYFEALYRTPACRIELRQRAKGIVQGFWRLYTDDFNDIRVPVPPKSEQTDIMDRLKVDLFHVTSSVDQFEREISLLREYRTRLISDVVTGKLDVREVAARLPDDVANGEPGENTEDLSDVDDGSADDADSAATENDE